jgi:hypothetical protein
MHCFECNTFRLGLTGGCKTCQAFAAGDRAHGLLTHTTWGNVRFVTADGCERSDYVDCLLIDVAVEVTDGATHERHGRHGPGSHVLLRRHYRRRINNDGSIEYREALEQ